MSNNRNTTGPSRADNTLARDSEPQGSTKSQGTNAKNRARRSNPRFIPLNVRSEYSHSTLTTKDIADLAADNNFPAIGVADIDNLFGAMEASENIARAGVQPIIGLTITVDFEDGGPPGQITLYPQNERGWENLMKIATATSFAKGRTRK